MALKNSTILSFPNASSNEDILKPDGDLASMGGSIYKNSSLELYNPENPLNTSSDEQEKVSGMDWDLTKIIGFCLGFALVANLILAIITGLAYSNWVKRRRDSFVEDEDETMRQGRFQFYCSRIANVICCKWKNKVNCPIKIIVEDYDQTLMMQQAKIEQKEEKSEMSGKQKKGNTPGTIHLQIFTVEADCHRSSSELKKEHIETGTSGLDGIGERQDVEGFVGKDGEKN